VRKLIAAMVAVVVVLGLLVVADRVALGVVESRIASTIQQDQQLQSRPSVKIDGFPFLTQVARHRFGRVTFRATDIKAGGTTAVDVASVSAVLNDVRTSNDFSSATAATATGTGTVTYAALSDQLGTTLSWGGTTSGTEDRLKATPKVTVLGQTLSASVTAQVQVTSAHTIGFTNVKVVGVGVPQLFVSGLEKVFAGSLTVSDLPAGLSLRAVSPTPEGVTLTLTGTNVQLQKN
jgi:hypothetical protein